MRAQKKGNYGAASSYFAELCCKVRASSTVVSLLLRPHNMRSTRKSSVQLACARRTANKKKFTATKTTVKHGNFFIITYVCYVNLMLCTGFFILNGIVFPELRSRPTITQLEKITPNGSCHF